MISLQTMSSIPCQHRNIVDHINIKQIKQITQTGFLELKPKSSIRDVCTSKSPRFIKGKLLTWYLGSIRCRTMTDKSQDPDIPGLGIVRDASFNFAFIVM